MNKLSKMIGLANQGKQYPAMDFVRADPAIAAVISKLTPGLKQNTLYGAKGNLEFRAPNTYEFRNVSNRTARNITDSESVMQLLPDMELAAQILTSSIISPKDLMTTELIFTAPEGIFPAQISGEVLTHLRTHFDQVYKIKPLLSKMLRDILFEQGSHVRAVIPENSLDELINRNTAVTTESLKDVIVKDNQIIPLGVLGSGITPGEVEKPSLGLGLESFNEYTFGRPVESKVTLKYRPATADKDSGELKYGEENYWQNPYITVTDNPDVLKMPELQEKLRSQRVASALNRATGRTNQSLESLKDRLRKSTGTQQVASEAGVEKLSDRDLRRGLYKQGSNGYQQVAAMRTQEQVKRRTVGNPLIMELPPESVIPVYVPGQESKHVGYFVLLDQNGNPLTRQVSQDYYRDMSQRMGGASGDAGLPSQLIQRVQAGMNGYNCSNNAHLDYSAKVYEDMIEQDLLARLRNGIYANGVALAKNEEVYRIMLARTLSRQQTQLLFLPIELVTYFAFRYNGDGIGKSLLDDMKVLNSLRATLKFANTMASVRNSIGKTNVKLKLDEDDGDPQKTIERMMDTIVMGRRPVLPVGLQNPADIVTHLTQAGFNFSYEGHPGLPDVQAEFSESNSSYPMPDTTLEDNLRKQAIMATGLSPETVDSGFNPDFATSVVANNVLLSRRVMQLQEMFCPMLMDHLRKVVQGSEGLMKAIRGVVLEKYDQIPRPDEALVELIVGGGDEKTRLVDYYVAEFLNGVEVQLPRPNTVTMENQATALESYTKLLDQALNAWISDEFLTEELGGDAAANATQIKALIRSYFLRQWMAENGVLPELAVITSESEDAAGKPMVDFYNAHSDHMKSLMRGLAGFKAGLKPTEEAADAALKAAGVDSSGGFGGGGDSSFETDTGSTAADPEADAFGMDDLPGDLSAEPTEGETQPTQDDTSLNDGLDLEDEPKA